MVLRAPVTLGGPAWDNQRGWRGHGPVSRRWTRPSIKPLCPMGWQGWAFILLRRGPGGGGWQKWENDGRSKAVCHHVIKLIITLDDRRFTLFALLCNRQWKLQLWETKYLTFLSLTGNATLCELVFWWPERPKWVILQLSRTATSQASRERGGTTGGTGALRHNKERKKEKENTLSHSQHSPELHGAVFN